MMIKMEMLNFRTDTRKLINMIASSQIIETLIIY